MKINFVNLGKLKNMDYSLDIPLKVEKKECDRNGNCLGFDVEVKMEKDSGTNDVDWCVSSFGCNDLLEPLFFKQISEPEGLQCGLCNGFFADHDAILKHNIAHLRVTLVNPIIYRCYHCASYFTEKETLESHLYRHNRSITKTLSYKPKSYKTFEALQNTISKLKDGMTNLLPYKPKSFKHDDTKTRFCSKCNKKFMYRHWHAHMKEVHGKGGYSCDVCSMVFKCERYLKKHLTRIHVGIEPRGAVKANVNCDQCDAILNSLYALTTHRRNVHSATKHVCYICKSTLKCKSYLLAHMRRLHCNDGKKHQCECGKSFKSRRYLMVHKRNSHSKGKRKIAVKAQDIIVD